MTILVMSLSSSWDRLHVSRWSPVLNSLKQAHGFLVMLVTSPQLPCEKLETSRWAHVTSLSRESWRNLNWLSIHTHPQRSRNMQEIDLLWFVWQVLHCLPWPNYLSEIRNGFCQAHLKHSRSAHEGKSAALQTVLHSDNVTGYYHSKILTL